MPALEHMSLDIIASLPNRREVNQQSVQQLIESISTLGLRTPVTVRLVDGFTDVDGVIVDGQPVLVTGAHRLAAVRSLGWEKIECYVMDDGSEIDAELWEIDENLFRKWQSP